MIDGNTLKFGYGDICVGSERLNRILTFQQFKPPARCGDSVPEDVEYIGDKIILELSSYKEYCQLKKYLEGISERVISKFTFKDYIFDFTNYNEESIKVCEYNLTYAMSLYFMAMAC